MQESDMTPITMQEQPVTAPATSQSGYDVMRIRQDFPILARTVRDNKPLVYLDNGATTQKPKSVVDRMSRFYLEEYGTVRRGVYALSEGATQLFDQARQTVARFLHAGDPNQIVFTRGTTESINLVAASFARPRLQPGDEIVISAMEHHANIVPWQRVCEEKGATLKVIPVNQRGELILDELPRLLSEKTKLVSVMHVSNVLGTINPVREIIAMAHAQGVPVLIDGAQAVPHQPVDVTELDCDFYVFSGHKIYGPTGVGVLYGKREHLRAMEPYQCGGDMIETVTFEKTTFAQPPNRFEAGTPAIAEVIGLAEALNYVSSIGLDAIAAHEHALLIDAMEQLAEVPGFRPIGTAEHKAAVIAFTLEGVHPHDIGSLLDAEGIAVRAGHHCAQPLMAFYKVPATARASFGLYNTPDETRRLKDALISIHTLFAG